MIPQPFQWVGFVPFRSIYNLLNNLKLNNIVLVKSVDLLVQSTPKTGQITPPYIWASPLYDSLPLKRWKNFNLLCPLNFWTCLPRNHSSTSVFRQFAKIYLPSVSTGTRSVGNLLWRQRILTFVISVIPGQKVETVTSRISVTFWPKKVKLRIPEDLDDVVPRHNLQPITTSSFFYLFILCDKVFWLLIYPWPFDLERSSSVFEFHIDPRFVAPPIPEILRVEFFEEFFVAWMAVWLKLSKRVWEEKIWTLLYFPEFHSVILKISGFEPGHFRTSVIE